MQQQSNTIYIVDDHPAVCDALVTMATKDPTLTVVGQAHDGKTALEQMANLKPDLVVVDLKLPDMEGLALIARMRQQGSKAKVLVFSMLDPRVYISRIIQAGGNGFISKDRPVPEVLTTIQQVLHGYNCFPTIDHEHLYDPKSDPLERLSQRELAIMLALARGISNKDLANRLHLSERTISSHKTHILEKLGLSNLVEVIDFARSRNLLE
ncbi:response regulator transcription factor [Silvimonas soli]|uniref:response regulator transcription factor n=1 Tax=Silvimonas soli TaxID=2980100 RepID=UPI0024B36FC4|nr:response regulator transcription factor [Silvimonas soli]